MKLKDDDIKHIDRWLQFAGIDYIDVRYELVDHLITEYEQQDDGISLESFVKERINWCKSAAKKKEKCMHWGIQKSLLKRVLSVATDFRFLLPILIYLAIIFFLKEQFSTKTVRLLLLAPFFLTIALFLYRLAFKNFGKEKQVLAVTKLGTLLALPQIFLSIFYMPSIWTENLAFWQYQFLMPCALFMTLVNIAAIKEYDGLYKKIAKEYEYIKGSLA